MRLIYSSILD